MIPALCPLWSNVIVRKPWGYIKHGDTRSVHSSGTQGKHCKEMKKAQNINLVEVKNEPIWVNPPLFPISFSGTIFMNMRHEYCQPEHTEYPLNFANSPNFKYSLI